MSAGGPLDIFFCGDVALGRGIDQVLEYPSRPNLYEPWVRDAREYVALAEAANGPIPRRASPSYPWGDALEVLARERPDARIVNLETSITTSEEPWPDKGIHYRMHPRNVACLTRFAVDVCVLANNHVMDWGYRGLAETLSTLDAAGLRHAGAGPDSRSARAPSIIEAGEANRVVVFAYGVESSGIPREWAATGERPGVRLLPDLARAGLDEVVADVEASRRPGDVVVASIHWGGNWGYGVPDAHRRFAHRLVEDAGVDLVHGHSSHHPLGIEVHRSRPILYGCGDFVNDYEGIRGYESFRGDLSLMYLASFDRATGDLLGLRMVPMAIRRFRLERASAADAELLASILAREGRELGTNVVFEPASGFLRLKGLP